MFIDVIGYEEYFQINENGELYSKRTNKILKQHISKKGYVTVATKIGGRKGKSVCFKIHILVAKAFIPNPLNLTEINHKDGNKQNNKKTNLEWVTPSQNIQHAVNTGLLILPKGEDCYQSKFTNQEIIKIRALKGTKSIRQLAKDFNISHVSMIKILRNETYK